MFLHLSVILFTGGVCHTHLGRHSSPLRSACWDTVNKWAVHILLECQRSAKKQSTNYITTAHQSSGEGYVFSRFCLRECPCTGLYPTPGHVQLGPHCTWTPPPKRHVQTCSICNPYCRKGGRLVFDRNAFL